MKIFLIVHCISLVIAMVMFFKSVGIEAIKKDYLLITLFYIILPELIIILWIGLHFIKIEEEK